jgi:hypothetical protein
MVCLITVSLDISVSRFFLLLLFYFFPVEGFGLVPPLVHIFLFF